MTRTSGQIMREALERIAKRSNDIGAVDIALEALAAADAAPYLRENGANELLAAIESVTSSECWPPHMQGAACERCFLRKALADYRALNARGTKR